MFCSKCGKEINDEAVVCPNCGCAVEGKNTQSAPVSNAPTIENGEKPALATWALVCSFLVPIVGLILGIVGTVKYKTQSLKTKCIVAIPISIVVWIITAVVWASM